MIERVLIIERNHDAKLAIRDDVAKKFGIDDNKLQRLIDSGDEYEYEGKKYCFDIPDERAYN